MLKRVSFIALTVLLLALAGLCRVDAASSGVTARGPSDRPGAFTLVVSTAADISEAPAPTPSDAKGDLDCGVHCPSVLKPVTGIAATGRNPPRLAEVNADQVEGQILGRLDRPPRS